MSERPYECDYTGGLDDHLAAMRQARNEHMLLGEGEGVKVRIGDYLDWVDGIDSPGGRHVDGVVKALFAA